MEARFKADANFLEGDRLFVRLFTVFPRSTDSASLIYTDTCFVLVTRYSDTGCVCPSHDFSHTDAFADSIDVCMIVPRYIFKDFQN